MVDRKVLAAVGVFLLAVACWAGLTAWRSPGNSAPLPSASFASATAVPSPAAPATITASGSAGASASLVDPDHLGPDRLFIAQLGVDAPIVDVPVSDAGALSIPADPADVGLAVDGAPLAAGAGSSLLAGHVNLDGVDGALWRLASITPGARIITTDHAGTRRDWAVDGLSSVVKAALPGGLASSTGSRRLVVVTCGGAVHNHEYDDNVIVTAHPAATT